MANYIGDFVNPGKFRTKFVSATSGIESNQATSNLSPSNIIGFFDKPDRNLKGKGAPCRLTAFNRDYPELWNKTQPFLNEIDKQFKNLVPQQHKLQYQRCQQCQAQKEDKLRQVRSGVQVPPRFGDSHVQESRSQWGGKETN